MTVNRKVCRMLIMVGLLLTSHLHQHVVAQTFPGGSGIEVSVFVFSERNPALDDHFIEQLEDRTVLMIRSMLGSGAQVDLLRLPNLSGWLREHTLAELDAEKCRSFGCDTTEKTVVLCVRYAHGAFYLSGGEYDRHFDTFGPIQASQIVQRSMVEDAIGRMAMNCWTPIGKINSLQDGRFSIGFTNLARLMSVPNWSRLKKGAILQLYRETIHGNSLQQSAHPTQFLMIDRVTPSGVWSVPVGSSWDRDWFEYLGDPRARYLARRVTPQKGTSTIQVFLSGKIENQPDVLVPRGSCDVYVSETPPVGSKITSPVVGVTDRDGLATITVDSDNPVFVTVSYENNSITQPFVRGVTPEPAVFQFAYVGNQSDYITSLNWLHDKVRANSAVINSLVETINETAADGDVAVFGKLVDEALALSEVDDLVAKADAIEQLAKAEHLDLSDRVDDFRRTASQLRQQTEKLRQNLGKAKMFNISEHRLEEFQNLFNQMKWPEALAALERFANEFPDHPQSAKLAAFREAFRPKAAGQSQARETLLRSVGLSRSDTLMDRWDEIRNAIETLIQYDDSLYLSNVNAELDSWIDLLNMEIVDIKASNVPGLSVQEATKLKARASKAAQTKTEFDRLRPLIYSTAEKSKHVLSS